MIAAACSRVRVPLGSKAPLSVPSNTPRAVMTWAASMLVISSESVKSLELAALAPTTIMPISMAAVRSRLRVRLRFLILDFLLLKFKEKISMSTCLCLMRGH